MKVFLVVLGVCMLVGVASCKEEEEDPATSLEATVDPDPSDLQPEESRQIHIKVQPQTPFETHTGSQITEGELSTASTHEDASFHLDSRGSVTILQGATPNDDIIHIHQELSNKFQEAIEKSHLAYSAGAEPDMYFHAPYQWAYEVMAPSTGNYHSRVENRHPDGVVRGRYSLTEPDGSLRVVTYIAHPEDGFQATVHNEPIPDHSIPVPVTTSEFIHTHTGLPSTRIYTDKHTDTNFIQHRQPTTTFTRQRLHSQQNQPQIHPSSTTTRINQQLTQPRQNNQPQHQFTPDTPRTTNMRQQLNTNQQHQFWMQHPLYAQLNTQPIQHSPTTTQHRLTPSSQVVPSHFQQAQHKVRPVLHRQVTNVA